MTYQFRPATREQVGLLIGLVGASGSGKTYTAMRLASGIVGADSRFAVIDTEARRSLHYADKFLFDMCELKPPFRPEAYAEAIKAADCAGYKAIVVDSFSHEWAGEGGILEWAETELDRMAGDDYRKREACKMASWIKPKMAHKAMIQRLLQVRSHLILCFRAEEKVKMEKDDKGKTAIVPIGWQPICSKEVPYEMTVSFLLTPDKPGYPSPIKLQGQHQALFPLDHPITEESGAGVAKWAAGGIAKSTALVPPPLVEPSIKEKCRDLLVEIYGADFAPALTMLTTWTNKEGKQVTGKSDLNTISEKGLPVLLGKLRDLKSQMEKATEMPAADEIPFELLDDKSFGEE